MGEREFELVFDRFSHIFNLISKIPPVFSYFECLEYIFQSLWLKTSTLVSSVAEKFPINYIPYKYIYLTDKYDMVGFLQVLTRCNNKSMTIPPFIDCGSFKHLNNKSGISL